ncbi:alkene reductase [Algoriphagus sp. Y33]|uniref:alkene reductase n=1 Tax=Algoriphagus sp. Y33 TaxID=2772483 RepID=UPI00178226A2|nr:alkene reductase [Algoriphagus sp. Y33]
MKLLENIQLGNLTLKNKMAMSAMTRSRANTNGVVGDMTVQYYTQRSSAGLLITEAINISKNAIGSPLTPGIYTQEQIAAWKKVTDAVHSQGGIIIAQLWHTGRVGHSVDRNGKLPLAPSEVAIKGMKHFTSQGLKDYETPQEITIAEIKQTVNDYAKAAKNAMDAGFDGVELHAANGYLPNQFLAESANKRTDEYGGSFENKARFILEIMQALIATVGSDKVGIKISAYHPYGDMFYDDPVGTYNYLIDELNKIDFAFVELMKMNPYFPPPAHYPKHDEVEIYGSRINKPVIANTGYNKSSAEAEIEKGIARMVSFGTLFLANPDLPKRFELDAELNEPDRATMFGGGWEGYIDYPSLDEN